MFQRSNSTKPKHPHVLIRISSQFKSFSILNRTQFKPVVNQPSPPALSRQLPLSLLPSARNANWYRERHCAGKDGELLTMVDGMLIEWELTGFLTRQNWKIIFDNGYTIGYNRIYHQPTYMLSVCNIEDAAKQCIFY